MKCPSCKKIAVQVVMMVRKGKVVKFCPRCPGAVVPKFRSHQQRKYDRWELPKEVIKETQRLAPKSRYPDSPVLRDRVDSTPAKPRCVTYDWGMSSRSTADARAMGKAMGKLGPNVKLIFSDGFKRRWEAA